MAIQFNQRDGSKDVQKVQPFFSICRGEDVIEKGKLFLIQMAWAHYLAFPILALKFCRRVHWKHNKEQDANSFAGSQSEPLFCEFSGRSVPALFCCVGEWYHPIFIYGKPRVWTNVTLFMRVRVWLHCWPNKQSNQSEMYIPFSKSISFPFSNSIINIALRPQIHSATLFPLLIHSLYNSKVRFAWRNVLTITLQSFA